MQRFRLPICWFVACLAAARPAAAQPSEPPPSADDDTRPDAGTDAGTDDHEPIGDVILPDMAQDSGSEPEPPEPLPEPALAWEPAPGMVEYVSASTKLTEPSRQSPSSVWVITREQIELAGYRSVGEALADVPGLYVSYDLDNYNVAMRGLHGGARAGSRYIKVMIDNQPLSFAESSVNYLGPEFIPVIAIERIEVVRGPVSALYGAGALVGAVNVVTRRPAYEGELTSKTILYAGGNALGVRGVTGEGVQMVISERTFVLLAVGGSYLDRSGLEVPRDSPFRDRFVDAEGVALKTRDDTSKPVSLLGRIEQRAWDGRLTGLFVAQLHEASNEFYDLSVMSHATRSALYNTGGVLSFELPTSSGLTIISSAGVWAGGPRAAEQFDLGDAGFLIKRRYGSRRIEGGIEARYDHDNGSWLLIGADGQLDHEQLTSVIEVDRSTGAERIRTGDGSETLTNVAGYAQALFPVNAKLRLTANARWDQHNIYGGALSARLAMVAAVAPQLTLKLMAGRSYKPPSPDQLFGVGISPLDVSGDETVPPQYLYGAEGLVDLFITRQLALSVGGYYQHADTLAYTQVGHGLEARPISANSVGLETSLRTQYTFGDLRVDGSAGVTVQRLVTDTRVFGGLTEKAVPDNEGVPTMMMSSRLSVFGPRGVGGQLRFRYVGERTPSQSNLLLHGGTPDLTVPSYMLPRYAIVDFAAAAPDLGFGASSLKLRAGVSNVLDRRYADIGFNGVDIPALGRTVWASATTSF